MSAHKFPCDGTKRYIMDNTWGMCYCLAKTLALLPLSGTDKRSWKTRKELVPLAKMHLKFLRLNRNRK